MSDEEDPRLRYVPTTERNIVTKIKNPQLVHSCLEIYEFMDEFKNKKQYLSVSEFKRFIPMFSRKLGQDYVKKHGEQAYKELVVEYWKQINPYKEVYITRAKGDKDIVGVLPAAAVAAPSMEDGRNVELERANRQINTSERSDVAQKGYKEYIGLLAKSRTTQEAVKVFATARNKTVEQTKSLDAQRDEYYRTIAGKLPKSKNSSSSNPSITFEEEDEIFD